MTPMEQEGFIPELEVECGGPCPPNDHCSACGQYWERMKSEGYWDGDKGQWTDKGWSEILK